MRVVVKPAPRLIGFVNSTSDNAVPELRTNAAVVLPVMNPPTPQSSCAPPPRLTVSFDPAAANPPARFAFHCTCPGPVPTARVKVPVVSRTALLPTVALKMSGLVAGRLVPSCARTVPCVIVVGPV